MEGEKEMSQEICPNCKTTEVKKIGESNDSIKYSCINGHTFTIGIDLATKSGDIQKKTENKVLLKQKKTDSIWDRFKNLLKGNK